MENNVIPKPAYTMSEPHLSGYRVVLGYATLAEAQEAQQVLASIPERNEQEAGDPA